MDDDFLARSVHVCPGISYQLISLYHKPFIENRLQHTKTALEIVIFGTVFATDASKN